MKVLFEAHRKRSDMSLLVSPDGLWLFLMDADVPRVMNFKITGYPKGFIQAIERVLTPTAESAAWQIQSSTDALCGEVRWYVDIIIFKAEQMFIEPAGVRTESIEIRLRPEELKRFIDELEAYLVV